MMRLLLLTLLLSVTACTTSPPHKPGDICAIFKEKDDWYDEAKDASKRWNSPIPVMMSIMYQESRFVAKAKPPRKFSIVPSRRARARGCAIVLFAVCARFIGAEGVIKLCDMLLKFDTRR